MADCCSDKACEIDALRDRQSATLKIVLGINAAMFVVELTAGLLANSISLVADSLDMLGDALVYGFSLYVVARGARMKATAALFKGGIMAVFGLFVLGQAIYRFVVPHAPVFEVIGAIGLLVLAANSLCLVLLWRHRADDINMSSVWLCSRNDIIANVSVLFAALRCVAYEFTVARHHCWLVACRTLPSVSIARIAQCQGGASDIAQDRAVVYRDTYTSP